MEWSIDMVLRLDKNQPDHECVISTLSHWSIVCWKDIFWRGNIFLFQLESLFFLKTFSRPLKGHTSNIWQVLHSGKSLSFTFRWDNVSAIVPKMWNYMLYLFLNEGSIHSQQKCLLKKKSFEQKQWTWTFFICGLEKFVSTTINNSKVDPNVLQMAGCN